MDGLKDNADILFVLTTNRPEQLEGALSGRPGRIDQAIEVPLPDDIGRAERQIRRSAGIAVLTKRPLVVSVPAPVGSTEPAQMAPVVPAPVMPMVMMPPPVMPMMMMPPPVMPMMMPVPAPVMPMVSVIAVVTPVAMVIARVGARAAVVHVHDCLIGPRRFPAHRRRGEANRNGARRQQPLQHDDPPHLSLENLHRSAVPRGS
jgi:hypothetical protein